MDDIDLALLTSLQSLAPSELARRVARAPSRGIVRPRRSSCTCIRASDTRLNNMLVLRVPEKAAHSHLPHSVTLTSDDLRRLDKPVSLDWPGVDWVCAADLLGRESESIRGWIARGLFRTSHVNARSCRKRGNPVPFIWSPSPIDPNADLGAAPHPVWGTAWQTRYQHIPDGLEFELRRLPNFRPYPGRTRAASRRFRGWSFICPGLPHTGPCGRIVSRLFLPLVIPSPLLSFAPQGNNPPLDFSRLEPKFEPVLACHHCHKIRRFSSDNRNAWNEFVRDISRGILFGSEVTIPKSFTRTRRRAFKPKPRAAPRRDRVRELLLTTLTVPQIATRLGMATSTVHSHAEDIYRHANVHSRRELKLALPDEKSRGVDRNTAAPNLPLPRQGAGQRAEKPQDRQANSPVVPRKSVPPTSVLGGAHSRGNRRAETTEHSG